MYKKFAASLRTTFDKKIDGTGLAVFRITYALVLLCEIAQMYYFRHLIFDKIPYIDRAEIDFGIPISIWFIAVLFILFGAFTRFFTILNYIMGLVLIGSIHTFEYHAFYAYMGINFLMILLPVSQCLSIDRLFSKLKYSSISFQYNPSKTVSQLYYFIPPFLGIGLVYFDSVFFKLASPMWREGLGSWLPSSLPMITHVNTSVLLNCEYLIKLVGWITIVFEALFLFFFFKKKWRILTFILGMILHLGILLQFPIPWFALTVCSVYLLLVPVSFWQKLFQTKNSPTLTFFYDANCPVDSRTKIIISHLDWFNKVDFKTVQFDSKENDALKEITLDSLLVGAFSVDFNGNVYKGFDTYLQVLKRIFYLYPLSILLRIPGIYHIAKSLFNYTNSVENAHECKEENSIYNSDRLPNNNQIKIFKNLTLLDLKYKFIINILLFLTILQIGLLYKTWLVSDMEKGMGFKESRIDTLITKIIDSYSTISKNYFGLTNHPVFTNEIHFNKYNHIIAICYLDKNNNEKWLPIIDKNGQPDFYIYGQNWVNWTFRVNQKYINPKVLNNGIQRYTAFWSRKNNISLKNAKFLIKVKKIDSPKNWEKDFLNKQIAKPWIDGGYIEWKDNTFVSNIINIEKI
jgi:hypothetical protein